MEDRHSARLPFYRTSAVVACPDARIAEVTVHDMSLGGMFVEADSMTLPMAATVFVAFKLMRDGFNDDFLLPALVIRLTPTGAALMFLEMEENTLHGLYGTLYGAPSSRDWQPTPTLWLSKITNVASSNVRVQ